MPVKPRAIAKRRGRTSEETESQTPRTPRPLRGLILVFVLSFVSLFGVLLTATAIGGLGDWEGWQFIGLFGIVETASGIANIVSPNIWRLPVAELQTPRETRTKLAASAMLIPHWAGAARAFAGLVLIAIAGYKAGIDAETFYLLPFILALTLLILAVSALFARVGVAWPATDILELHVIWREKKYELPPLSLSASLLQFLISIITLPAIKIFAPGVLFGPELGPSATFLVSMLSITVFFGALVVFLWMGRISWQAAREQQREAEKNA